LWFVIYFHWSEYLYDPLYRRWRSVRILDHSPSVKLVGKFEATTSEVIRIGSNLEATYFEGAVGFNVLVREAGYSIYELKSYLTASEITVYVEGVLVEHFRDNR
jgi:hypothetical protein